MRHDIFLVRCTCGSGIEKELAWRYIRGDSLSCGCLRREIAAKQGRANLDPLNQGYQEWLEEARKDKPANKYAPKLPDTETLRRHRESGMTYQEIADLYGAHRASVGKRLRS